MYKSLIVLNWERRGGGGSKLSVLTVKVLVINQVLGHTIRAGGCQASSGISRTALNVHERGSFDGIESIKTIGAICVQVVRSRRPMN